MVAPRTYLDELREQLGINAGTRRGWVTQVDIDASGRAGTTTGDAARLAELEREVRGLRRANAILRRRRLLRGGDRPPVALILDYVERRKDTFGSSRSAPRRQTPAWRFAPSTFYAARNPPPSARAARDGRGADRHRRVSAENYGVYGIRGVTPSPAASRFASPGVRSRCSLARLMNALVLTGNLARRGATDHGRRRRTRHPA